MIHVFKNYVKLLDSKYFNKWQILAHSLLIYMAIENNKLMTCLMKFRT